MECFNLKDKWYESSSWVAEIQRKDSHSRKGVLKRRAREWGKCSRGVTGEPASWWVPFHPPMPLLILYLFPILPCTAPHHTGWPHSLPFQDGHLASYWIQPVWGTWEIRTEGREISFLFSWLPASSPATAVSSRPLLILNWVYLTSTSKSSSRSMNTTWSFALPNLHHACKI